MVVVVRQHQRRGGQVRREGHALLLRGIPAAARLLVLVFHVTAAAAVVLGGLTWELHLLLAITPPSVIHFRKAACVINSK